MKTSIVSVLVLLVVIGLGVTVIAQQTAAPEKQIEVTAPQFDDLDIARLQAVNIAAKRANDACQTLEAVKEFNELRAQVQAQVEARHQGFTVDWSRFALVAKVPTK